MESPFSLEGKRVLVTGAGSGIGRAISVMASNIGATIVLVDIRQDLMDETLLLLKGEGHISIQADLSDMEQIKSIVETVEPLDGLVNNAGIPNTKPLQFIGEDEYERVLSLNTKTPVFFTNLLFKKKKLAKGASLVFTSSLAGLYTFTPANGLYSMSKAALTSYAKSCAVEYASRGIRSNCVCPAMVNTHLRSSLGFSEEEYQKDVQKYLLKRYAEPEEIASAVVFLLSDGASYITGHTLLVDGGRSLK